MAKQEIKTYIYGRLKNIELNRDNESKEIVQVRKEEIQQLAANFEIKIKPKE